MGTIIPKNECLIKCSFLVENVDEYQIYFTSELRNNLRRTQKFVYLTLCFTKK